MKRTFVMEVDYAENNDGICESFGTTTKSLAETTIKIANYAMEKNIKSVSTAFIELCEKGKIPAEDVFSLATMYLVTAMALSNTEKL